MNINLEKILINKKSIFLIIALFLFLDLLSFFSFFNLKVNTLIFFLIIIITIVLSSYRLKWGIYLLWGELLINSMGQIFFFEISGFRISIRIALWSVVLIISLIKILRGGLKNFSLKNIPYFKPLAFLALFIFLALIQGLIRNDAIDVFFDFNAWLYFLSIIPIWQVISTMKEEERKSFYYDIVLIFLAAVLFLSLKSLLLLFCFSHNLDFISSLYYWSRDYRLGEITAMEGGFYRIFLQAQIFIALAWVIILSLREKMKAGLWLGILSFLSSALILSFSRSFWLAGALSFVILLVIQIRKRKINLALKTFFGTILSLVLGFCLVWLVVKIPIYTSSAQFNLAQLSDRAKISDSEEAAISSRWNLLAVMGDDLKQHFFSGRGFGARLEYHSNDPRVEGSYSTYAFEWGWLDVLLKLGLLGFISYLYLVLIFLKDKLKNGSSVALAFALSLFFLVTVNFFTPYLNHPLGIGYLIFLILLC